MYNLNDSVILEQLPDPAAVKERISEITAERNLLKGLLRVLELHEFRRPKANRQQRALTAAAGEAE